jgi:aminomethyltransferase
MSKKTPLYDQHIASEARVVDFSGWLMPVQYKTGIIKEHVATRETCGLFDTCHMGEFLIEAPCVRTALNCCLSGDFSKVKDYRERYTFITADDGGVIDDAVVMIFSKTKAWIVVNAGDINGDFQWISDHLPETATATNLSAQTSKLDVQGPKAFDLVEKLTGVNLDSMPFYSFCESKWQGQDLIISRSGYTGEQGVEFYIANEAVVSLWTELLKAGSEFGLILCGLGARDTLRLEAGLPLYGHEMNRQTNPIQAGQGRFVSLTKEEDFPGKEALIKSTEIGSTDVLVGLKLNSKRVARHGFILKDGDKEIGLITSGAPCPTIGDSLALAYVKPEYASADTIVNIEVRKKLIPATVVALPFYTNPILRKKS